jgi:hypothetical protein
MKVKKVFLPIKICIYIYIYIYIFSIYEQKFRSNIILTVKNKSLFGYKYRRREIVHFITQGQYFTIV